MSKKKIFIILGIIILVIISICVIINRNKNNNLEYQIEEVKEIDYMVFMENNKYGVINRNGEIIVSPYYDEIQIPNPSKSLFICMYDYDVEKNQYKIKVLNEKK